MVCSRGEPPPKQPAALQAEARTPQHHERPTEAKRLVRVAYGWLRSAQGSFYDTCSSTGLGTPSGSKRTLNPDSSPSSLRLEMRRGGSQVWQPHPTEHQADQARQTERRTLTKGPVVVWVTMEPECGPVVPSPAS